MHIGVDGYSRGWVAVALTTAGAYRTAWAAPTLDALLAGVSDEYPIGVDIPLGLIERGWRQADRLAAARLGPRRASIFAVPPRSAWTATSAAEANQRCRALCDGAGFSIQAWGLRSKVLEAESYEGPHRLYEVHPELAFAGMSGAPMAAAKKTWNGQRARQRALRAAGIRLPEQLAGAAGAVPVDDVLDAAAVAWTARRLALGVAGRLPDPPDQLDHRGRPIAIHF